MPYNEQTEYPRGLYYSNAIGGADVTVSTADIMIVHAIVRGGTAAGVTVRFQNVGSTFTYRSFSTDPSQTVVLSESWYANQGGLLVDTQPAGNNDTTIILFYVTL